MRVAALGQASTRPRTVMHFRATISARRCLSRDAPASVAQLLEWKPSEAADGVSVHGFVRSVRGMKANRFVSLGDGSSLAPLQAVVPPEIVQGLSIGSAVRLTGSWVASRGSRQSHELQVSELEVLGPSDAKTFPIQKKYQTPEYLRALPHLRPRTPFNSVLLRLRSTAIASLTQFFVSRKFTQTHPPIITSSDCEGGGNVFAVMGPSKEVCVPEKGLDGEDEFFRGPKYMTVSSQLHLEALAQAVGNVWALSPTFRAERSDTARHLSEFYMLEAEMGFVNQMDKVMDLVEDMLRYLTTNLHNSKLAEELLSRSHQLGSDLAPADQVKQRWEGLIRPSWPRVTYTEAVSILQAKADLFTHKPTWGAPLQAEHEKFLAHTVNGGQSPIFVTDYPRGIKPFYMRQGRTRDPGSGSSSELDPSGADRATVECFDLLVPVFFEIAGGSMREHRLEPLLRAMQLHGLAMPTLDSPSEGEAVQAQRRDEGSGSQSSLDWYVDLRRWGSPPHGGFGLGFDRLLSYLAGVQTIRDMVTFPRWLGRCDC